ncbi:MAG: UDP-N-acetylmuramate dehydrogenase [Clostridiales bacterium]|nr:UDP-N-acetylmuramate dehydrogenase [Candidatus Crickella merdequi]
MKEITAKLKAILPAERIHENEPMKLHTSFKIGGPADIYAEVATVDELKAVLRLMADTGAEHMLVGNGSNFLVSDEGYRGVMIRLGGDFDSISLEGSRITVGASKLLSGVSAFATENGLAGFEFASGIPGSIGGAIFMNAGAYGGEMKDVVKKVSLVSADGSQNFQCSGEEMGFGYRMSSVQATGAVVTEVVIELTQDDKEAIAERVKELAYKRNSKQPVQFPSAGSTFKRPVGGYAAALIEEAGLKGFTVGGAQVSEKHSGFVINIGDATCSDVIELMKAVRQKVYENSGIVLEPEVRIIGEEFEEFNC